MHICSLLISGMHILKGTSQLIADANKEGGTRSFLQSPLSFGSQEPTPAPQGREQNLLPGRAQRSSLSFH